MLLRDGVSHEDVSVVEYPLLTLMLNFRLFGKENSKKSRQLVFIPDDFFSTECNRCAIKTNANGRNSLKTFAKSIGFCKITKIRKISSCKNRINDKKKSLGIISFSEIVKMKHFLWFENEDFPLRRVTHRVERLRSTRISTIFLRGFRRRISQRK